MESRLPFIEGQFIDVNYLWRSKKTVLDEIGCYKIGKRIITYLKTVSGNKRSLLGNIRWLGQINQIDCAGIELDEIYKFGNSGKLDNRIKFPTKEKHGVFTPLTNVEIVENYTSSLIPLNLTSSTGIEMQSRVKVYLTKSECSIKLYGTVMWYGHNDDRDYFYGIKLDNPVADGTDGLFSHQRLFTCKNKSGILTPVESVKLLGTRVKNEVTVVERSTMDKEIYESIIMMLLKNRDDVNEQNDDQKTIFDIANDLADKSIVYCMLDVCNQDIHLSNTRSMEVILSRIVESGNQDLLSRILSKSIIDDNSNKYLLLLSITALMEKNDFETFCKIFGICTDFNAILDNGETFLTCLLKSGCNDETVKKIIKRYKFNLNVPNASNETPLILACESLRVPIVEVLVNRNCDIKFNNHKALEVSFYAKAQASQEGNNSKVKAGSQIIEMLSEANASKESLLCQICMDNNKDVALNCGHTVCSICEAKLYSCPFCNTPIKKGLKIYL